MKGERILLEELVSQHNLIEIPEWNQGIYLISIIHKGKIESKQFLVN